MSSWRGLKALVHDAVDATTELVDEGQASAHRAVRRLTDELPMPAASAGVNDLVRLGSRGTLATVRAVNRVVEALSDAALDHTLPPEPPSAPIPLRSDIVGSAAWIADAALGAVNGAIGHQLAGNGLDLGLQLRLDDAWLDGPAPPMDAVVVLVHGLGTTEWCWSLEAATRLGDPASTFGTLLQRDVGLHPVYARYNTGRPIRDNGAALAQVLHQAFPNPPRRLVLVGHSMGGLVARDACRQAAEHGLPWLAAVDPVVSIGSPHHGAPLARFGEHATQGLGGVDLPATRVIARILAGRSLGVRDLEHGELRPDLLVDVPQVPGLRYAFIGATVATDPDHLASRWLGDLLVPLDSAGTEAGATHVGGVLHHHLQVHPAVYQEMRAAIAG